MNVRDLKKAIKDLPDTMEVFIDKDEDNEYQFELVDTAEVKNILFFDSSYPDDEYTRANDDVLVLTSL